MTAVLGCKSARVARGAQGAVVHTYQPIILFQVRIVSILAGGPQRQCLLVPRKYLLRQVSMGSHGKTMGALTAAMGRVLAMVPSWALASPCRKPAGDVRTSEIRVGARLLIRVGVGDDCRRMGQLARADGAGRSALRSSRRMSFLLAMLAVDIRRAVGAPDVWCWRAVEVASAQGLGAEI